jgi:ABC-type Fe3+/spermidine/putrescine transport system ATPase subunit
MGVTAIFVTHDQSEAFSVADRVAILFDGRLEQFDRPETIYKTPATSTVARFLGFKNIFAAADLADLGFVTPEDCLPPGVTASSSAVLIRPEAARLHTETITEKKEKEPKTIITGTVESRLFQGATYRVKILSGHHTLHFDLPVEPTPPVAGKNIKIEIRHSAIVQLPAES